MVEITQYGAFILAYEAAAKALGWPTWTALVAARSPWGLPVVVFLIWLAVHLWTAFWEQHD